MSTVHDGHRKRLREELVKNNFPDTVPDHKILELLLFYAVPRKDTNEIAHNLINAFGSFSGVFNADYEDLVKVPGVGENAATLIKMILPVARRYANGTKKGITFNNRKEIAEFLIGQYFGDRKEKFIMLSLDNKLKLICVDVLSTGGIHSVNFEVRDVLAAAMRSHASLVVLAHNHPEGFARASVDDKKATINVNNALSSIDIKLLEHVVIANDDYELMSQNPDLKFIFVQNVFK